MRTHHAGRLAISLTLAAAFATAACDPQMLPITQLVDARAVAANLRVQFARASDLTSQAVLADASGTSAQAATDARAARSDIEASAQKLRQLLESLRYSKDAGLLQEFDTAYAEYRSLDDAVLELAGANSNVKAQQLLFGSVREASDALRGQLSSTAARVPARTREHAELLAIRAENALLEWQVLQARHVAEADDAAMDTLEQRMRDLDRSLEAAVAELRRTVPTDAGPAMNEAATSVTRLRESHAELVRLSRLNTNVRSVALMFGRRRVVVAACHDALTALSAALENHTFAGTR